MDFGEIHPTFVVALFDGVADGLVEARRENGRRGYGEVAGFKERGPGVDRENVFDHIL